MTQCWAEGTLRAYHDGELSPAEMEQVESHLSECSVCAKLADVVSSRAVLVQNLLSALPGPEQLMWMPRCEPKPVSIWPRWAAAGAAIAAAITIVFLWSLAKAPDVVTKGAAVASAAGSNEVEATAPAQRAEAALSSARVIRKPARQKPSSPRQAFLVLDDQPIETGVVVRMALGDAGIPADVVFGADGRAHAIRLVDSRTMY